MTIEELGRKVKKQYPDYKSKSDLEVGNAILQRYPEYQSRITGKVSDQQPKIKTEVKEELPTGSIFGAPTGMMKGVAQSFLGAASLPQKVGVGVGKWAAEKITGKPAIVPEPFKKTIRERVDETGALKAETKWERRGKAAEQVGEFFVSPGAKVKALTKLPLAKDLIVRGAKEGVRFGGVTAVQKGEVDKEVGTAFMFGAAVPGVSMVGSKIYKGLGSIRKGYQEKAWIDILQRTRNDIAANPISADVAKQSIFAWSAKGVGGAFTKSIEKSQKVVDAALATKTSAIKVEGLKKAITNAAIAEIKSTATPLTPLIKDHIVLTRAGVNTIVNRYIKPGQTSISRENAFKLSLNILKDIEKSVMKGDAGAISIPKQFADELLKRTIKILPKMKKDIDRIAILSEAMPAMTNSIASRKTLPYFTQQNIGLGILGEFTGVGGLKVFLGKKVIDSVAFKSKVSQMLNTFNKLPEADKIPFYLGVKGILASAIERYIAKD